MTQASFDLRSAPDAAGLFVGDYMGLEGVGGHFGELFVSANGSGDPATVNFAVEP